MVENFEAITYELTDAEKAILPVMVTGFLNYRKDNPIKEPQIVANFNDRNPGHRLTPVRLRKLVNYIRVNGILPLIATSKGYYVSYDKAEIRSQITSLEQRAASIENCAHGLRKFLN